MSIIPLHWLLLLLANLTGVAPVPVPAEVQAVIRPEVTAGTGYYCGGMTSRFSVLCPPEYGDAVQLSPTLWQQPLLMQHLALHEYGHRLGSGSEDEAERFACRAVPMRVIVSGATCAP